MDTIPRQPQGKILLAFAIIYFVWGSTFYAIRVGVECVPPLLLASMRFVAAGGAMLAWLLARRVQLPTGRQWAAATLLGFLMFVCDYGLLFWAETRVPSGIAAVILATIPVFIALSEIVLLRTQRLTAKLGVALLIGVGGVAVLVSRSLNLGGGAVDALGAAGLIMAAISWSVSTALTKKLPLPESKAMSSAAQMFSGGVMLVVVAAAFGEFRGFSLQAVPMRAWLALAYLIVFGSIIGFTAYVWLLHHESPTKVGTYAYVNPVVAVLVGYFLGGEPLGARTVLGTACVLVSVVLITRGGRKQAVEKQVAEKSAS